VTTYGSSLKSWSLKTIFLVVRERERERERERGMQPKLFLITTQFVALWAQKFTLLLTLQAFPDEEVDMDARISKMVEEIFQFGVMLRCCKAIVTIRESISRIKFLSSRETASSATRASLEFGSHEGL
jgi:hypothetical protein